MLRVCGRFFLRDISTTQRAIIATMTAVAPTPTPMPTFAPVERPPSEGSAAGVEVVWVEAFVVVG
jgi:hypothetical protein